MFRRVSLIFISVLVIAAFPLFAGGGKETEPGVGETPESNPVTESTQSAEPALLDAETKTLLFNLGFTPFRNRVPSENFVLELLSGGERALDDYRDKVVLLNFWATWCPPCREEMPSMQTLYDELADEGLEILAVNVSEEPDVVANFIEENGYSFPVLLDREGRVQLRYSVRAIPTTFVVDRDGSVLGMRPGYHDWSDPAIVEGIRTLLAE